MERALEIEPRDVHEQLSGDDELLMLDCRTQDEWDICHIAGSTLLPLQEMSLRIAELEQYRHTPIVVYCHKGARSMIITRLLRHSGFTHVQSMAGGIDRWANEIDADMAIY
jgi:rhodanese-related sulfurtransferase